MGTTSKLTRRLVNSTARSVSGLASVGSATLALSASSTSVADGDIVTLAFTGPAGTHLRKDGVWVATGKNSPCVLRVSQLDAGTYTACYWDGVTLIESSPVVLTVAANDLVSDSFTSGSPSANWSSTTGTITVTSQKMVVNLATSGYLERTITGDKARIAFTINPSNLASGFGTLFTLLGASTGTAIVSGNLIYGGASLFYLALAPNAAGYYRGGSKVLNYDINTAITYVVLLNGDNVVEVFWDNESKDVEIYLNSVPVLIVRDCIDFGSGFVTENPATFRIGRVVDGATGTVTIDNVKVKQGNAALTPYALGSKWAVVNIIGQSNGQGAATSSYSSTTDAIGPYLLFQSDATENTTKLVSASEYVSGSSSVSVAQPFIQNIDLPANHIAILSNVAVGSTSFTAGSGLWEPVSVTGTASSATSSTLTDSTKSWATNEFGNALRSVVITGGTGSGQFRQIQSNTSTVITTVTAWATTPDATSTYEIVGSKRQSAIAVVTLVSEIASAIKNIVVWHQGFEGDTGLSSSAYTALLTDLVSDFRAAIGDSCPLIIGGFSPAFLTGGENETAGYITIDTANEAYANANNGAFASSLLPTPLTYQAGNPNWIHFDGAGYRGLGARGATNYLTINKAAKPN